MILGREKILEFVKEKNLIENFSLDCLGGSGYDLRVNRVYRLKSGSHLDKKRPEIEEIGFDEFVIRPKEYILIETIEKINMPCNLVGMILPRSTLFRCGCFLTTALIDPGFRGSLTIGMKNLSEFDFRFDKSARIAQIVFEIVEGKTRLYKGRYQGGKVV